MIPQAIYSNQDWVRSIMPCVVLGIVYCVAPGKSLGSNLLPTIEGPEESLRVLRDAQATNRTLFRRGELEAKVRERVGGVAADAKLVWQDDETYWDYTLTRTRATGNETKTVHARMIEGPGKLACYYPSTGLALTYLKKSRGYPAELKLRPDQVWFRYERHNPWQELLDPSARSSRSVSKFVVRKEADDRIVVERHVPSFGIMRIVGSLKAGGNVISYEEVPGEKGGWWAKGNYEWTQDDNGNWYLKHMDYQRSHAGDPKQLDVDYSLDVIRFDPNPDIPRNRFQFASFELPQGTTVKETDGDRRRTYRIGKERRRVSQNQLDQLAEKLKSGGFAARKRKSDY